MVQIVEDGFNAVNCQLPAGGAVHVRVIPANDASYFVACRQGAEAVIVSIDGDFVTAQDRYYLWMFLNHRL